MRQITQHQGLMLPTGLPAFARSTARLFAPGGRGGAWPAIEPSALLQRPLQPVGYMRRLLASRSSAMDAGEERVLPRSWWPEECAHGPRVLAAEEAGASGAVRFLLELASRLDPVAAARPTELAGSSGSRSASVAVVLRLSKQGRPLAPGLASKISSAIVAQQQRHVRAVDSLPEPEQQANEILHGYPDDELQGVQVEVLYISRTVVGADGSRDARRWSGQIAFPGGKSQGDETPLETACRESVEEVQLDLTSTDFRLIGRLPPRTAKAGLPLNAFVFVHTSGMAQVIPDPFEVQTLFRDLNTSQDVPRPLRRLLHTLGVGGLLFPCIQLPPPSFASVPPPHPVTHTATATDTDAPVAQERSSQPPLWGLTLGLTSDLMEAGCIQKSNGQPPTEPSQVRGFEFCNRHGHPLPWAQTLATAMAAAYQGKVGSVGQRRSVGKRAAAAGLVLLLLVVAVVRRVGV